jgi:membrane protease subunit HflK
MLASILNRLGVRPTRNNPLAQDGKRPGEGPPDLDQLWRDFNARLNRLFGGNGDNNGNGQPPAPGGYRPGSKGAGTTATLIAIIAAFIWLASGTFSVREGHAGVVTTFGSPDRIANPGLNWRLPAPFQAHELVNVSQVRTEEIGYRGTVSSKTAKEALMLTEDENIIDVQFAVQYTLNDPVAWLFNNREQEDTVRQVAETAMREVVGLNKTDFVLNVGRDKVAMDTRVIMQKLVNEYKLGVLVTNVTMQSVQPPEQVQGAFEDVNKAKQDQDRAKNEGEAYANQVLPIARGNAIRLKKEAEAYRTMVTENASGNAARFTQVLAEYQKAPAVTRDRMYLDTMQQIFTSASKVLIDAKSGSNLLYLPLDKLIAQTAANDAAIGAKSGPVAVPVPAEVVSPMDHVRQRDNRARESSRDRESR